MRSFIIVLLSGLLLSCSDADVPLAEMTLPGSDAAMAPRLSTLPNGHVLLSWLEPAGEGTDTSILHFSRFDGERWSATRQAAQGDDWFNNWADTAGVTALDNGLLVAHWLQKNGESTYAYEVRYSVSSDGGDTWTDAQTAHDDDSASEHGFVSVVSRDDGFEMAWLDGRHSLQEDGGMTLRIGRFAADGERLLETEVDGLTCDCCPTDAMRAGDRTLIVYRDRDVDERRDIMMASVDASGQVQREIVNRDGWIMPACPVNGPAITKSGDETHVLWFTAANDVREIRHATKRGDAAFGTPQTVASGDSQGRVDLVNTGKGLVGMWLAGSGDHGRIELVRIDGKSVKSIGVIDGMSVSRHVGYPQLAALPDGDLLVVWTGGDASPGLQARRMAF